MWASANVIEQAAQRGENGAKEMQRNVNLRKDVPGAYTAFMAGQAHFLANRTLDTMPRLDEYRAILFVRGYRQEMEDACDAIIV